MINSIDQSTDYSNKELYQYLTGINLPEFVKSASIDDTKGGATYASSDRHFPIGSPVKVYVSTAHFLNKAAALAKLKGKEYTAKVADALDKAAAVFKITDSVSELTKAAAFREFSEPEEISITAKLAGDHLELFTVKTANDIASNAASFEKNINKYPYEWRRDIADQFVKAAEYLGVDELPALVLKYAGQYYPNIVEVKAELKRRMTKLSGENKARYEQLLGDVDNTRSIEEFFKLAECCHFTEKNAGLYDKHQSRVILGDVVDKFFTMHFDKVAEVLDYVEMGGEKFASADLFQVPSDIYHEAFGFELDPKSAEAKDILPTMPKADVSLFKELSGVKPI